MNKVIQTYRIWKWFQYKLSAIKTNFRLLEPLKYMPFYIIVTIYLAHIVLNLSCTFDAAIPPQELFSGGVTCKKNSWISKSKFLKPITYLKVFYYGLYFVSSIVTGVGLQARK